MLDSHYSGFTTSPENYNVLMLGSFFAVLRVNIFFLGGFKQVQGKVELVFHLFLNHFTYESLVIKMFAFPI